jgi:DNA-binding XRE family transcriptional regulator
LEDLVVHQMRGSGRHFDITPAQCRAARAVLRISQPELGTLSNLSRDVIVRLERASGGLHYTTPGLVEAALSARGITLIHDETGPGLRIEREVPVTSQMAADEIVTPRQCRAARAMLDMNLRHLARLVAVNKQRLLDHESGKSQVDLTLLKRIRATLVVNGIVFTNEKSFVAVQLKALWTRQPPGAGRPSSL